MGKSGILLHLTSLSSPYGIGTAGKQAYSFVDFLADSAQSVWQILPLSPTGFGDSPYSPACAFAFNPYLIDLDTLCQDGLLLESDYNNVDFGSGGTDYGKLFNSREKVLLKAAERFDFNNAAYLDFKEKNAFWLEDFALFSAIKRANGDMPWEKWQDVFRFREKDVLKAFACDNADYLNYIRFTQFAFYSQWKKLKRYANSKNIKIFGDIPIYCAYDSSDVWANPELFILDKNLLPEMVAGVPPDGFSADGQLWGNPLYRWQEHKRDGYSWWIERISQAFDICDIVRIDHFRGFESFYAVPYGDKNAKRGEWQKGPGAELFKIIERNLGKKDIVAEDLGYLDPSVREMLKECGYPGMKVLQFAFDGNPQNEYLPHLHTKNCVVYTGTHDNETSRQWYRGLSKERKRFFREYLDIKPSQNAVMAMIEAALSSRAELSIIPMQDWLNLDKSARMNYPSTTGNNWKWRLKEGALTAQLAQKIKRLTEKYSRQAD